MDKNNRASQLANNVYKIMIIGDFAVGKTSFMRQTFDEPTKVSVGIDCGTTHCFIDGEDVTLKVWDTAGEEKF